MWTPRMKGTQNEPKRDRLFSGKESIAFLLRLRLTLLLRCSNTVEEHRAEETGNDLKSKL
jgi:hypothetical protein